MSVEAEARARTFRKDNPILYFYILESARAKIGESYTPSEKRKPPEKESAAKCIDCGVQLSDSRSLRCKRHAKQYAASERDLMRGIWADKPKPLRKPKPLPKPLPTCSDCGDAVAYRNAGRCQRHLDEAWERVRWARA